MAQYVPNVTEVDIERVVRRDYPPEIHATIHEMIRGVEVREKPRVILACLKKANGNLQKLKGELTNAGGYWRTTQKRCSGPIAFPRKRRSE
jgi:hypothetical protein